MKKRTRTPRSRERELEAENAKLREAVDKARRESNTQRRFAIVLAQLRACADIMLDEGRSGLAGAILSAAQSVETSMLSLVDDEEAPF